MPRIVIDQPPRPSAPQPTPSVQNENVVMGYFFNSFVESQRAIVRNGIVEKKGLSDAGVVEMKEKTCDILSHCNPHDATRNTETTHLVVGYVQSGKTMSFTALSALARDNHYRLIIYLAGTKTNLLDQTYARLRKDLVGDNAANRDAYIIIKDPTKRDIQQVINGLQSDKKPTLLLPTLKHHKHIKEIAKIFADNNMQYLLADETVLIIDDEADQTSLNTYGRKNSQNGDIDRRSSTYGAILKLRAQLPGNSYIQYTATPQANLLISMQDLLAPKGHTLLNPGEDYVGGKLFFGQGPDNSLFNGGLIIRIPPAEVFNRKNNPLSSMPKSLEYALKLHILAVALVVEWRKTEGIDYLSMMVHPDSRKETNRMFKDWIDDKLRLWGKLLRKEDGHDDKEDLLKDFEAIYNNEAIKYYDEGEYPPFQVLRPMIREVLCRYQTYLVNSDSDANKEIDWDQFKMHILVGAEMLNRGFTVEKLATTYMPRYNLGKANADTIEQRCRFFGYKRDYIKSCRVFLPEQSIISYMEYVEHEEELRQTLAESPSLADAERSIMLSDRLNPTRSNVIPSSVVSTELKGMRGMMAFESRSVIENNDRLVNDFLNKHENDFNLIYAYNTADRMHRGFKTSIDDAIELLRGFRFGNETDVTRKIYTIRYLKYLAAAMRIDSVYFIHMAYGATRHRRFNNDTKRLEVGRNFFAGRSTTGTDTYPGDSAILGGEETLTIQLHRFILDGAAVDFPHESYTLAIYYPETLSTAYIGSVGYYDDYDDDED